MKVNKRKGGVFVREKHKKRVLVDHQRHHQIGYPVTHQRLGGTMPRNYSPNAPVCGELAESTIRGGQEGMSSFRWTAVAIYDFSENFNKTTSFNLQIAKPKLFTIS